MAGTVYSDVNTINAIPDAMRPIFSSQLEFTARTNLITDQPEFVEMWPEFGSKRGSTVTRTIWHQLAPTISPLTENQDVAGGGTQDHQVSFTIAEYGNAIGVSEALDLLSYQGPVSSIIKSLLGPQMGLTFDTVARNTLWNAPNISGGVQFIKYANGARASRATLTTSDVLTADFVRRSAYNLGVRQVPTLGEREPSYVCLTHPSTIYDLRNDSQWKDSNLYAGSTRIFNGEEGMIHGVRFLKSTRYRVANGGNLNYQTTLSAGTYAAGTNTVIVASTTNLVVGDEITLHATGTATTATDQHSGSTTWQAPNGQDGVEEQLVIKAINTGTRTITFTNPMQFTHVTSEYFTDAYDVYPLTFLGGVPVLAKGVAVAPEVRVALPTDKLRRMSFVGWYALQGYGVSRPWAYEIDEVLSSVNTAPVYGI